MSRLDMSVERSNSKLQKRLNLTRLAAYSAAALLLPTAANAALIFQVTPGDFNASTGVLTADVGGTAQLTSSSGAAATTGVTLNTSATNNLPSLVFDGSAGFKLATPLVSTTNQLTVIAVVLPNSSANPETLVAGDRSSLQYRLNADTNGNELQEELSRAVARVANSGVGVDTTKFSVIDLTNQVTTNPVKSHIILNNNGAYVGDPNSASINVNSISYFGGAQNGTGTNEFFNGQIAEIQVYDTALSTTDRQTIENNLLSSFGIAPYNFQFSAASGQFDQGSNFNTGTSPNNATLYQAVVNNGGTAQIVSGDTIGLLNFFVGGNADANSGNVVQTGGDLTVSKIFSIGRNGGAGTYALSGGTITATSFYVGGGDGTGAGTGVFTQTGGAITVSSDFQVGNGNGQGTYNMSGGTLVYNGTATAAIRGFGANFSTMSLSGTAAVTINTGGAFIVGEQPTNPTGTGVLNVTDSATLTTAAGVDIRVGSNGGTGILNVSNGSVLSGSWLRLGYNNGTGTANLSGGTLGLVSTNTAGNISIGSSGTGTGTLNQTGGALVSNGPFVFLGEFAPSAGTWNMSGGTANVGQIVDGYRNVGVLNISGTAFLTARTGVDLGNIAGSKGTLNLNGGTLSTTSVFPGPTTTTAVVNLNGGILQAAAAGALIASNFPAGSVNILAGGAIFDTNGFNVTVGSSISSPAGVVGGFTKIGAGTLQLTGSNSYTGKTTISAGTLQLTPPSTPVAVPNYSFQTPAVTTYTYAPAGASWTFGPSSGTGHYGSGITINGAGFNYSGTIPDGNQYAFLQGNGTITQPITFPNTGSYTLGFYSEQRNGGNDAPESFYVNVDGTDITGGNGVTPGATWAQTTFVLAETAGAHTLQFQGVENPFSLDKTALIDLVTINGSFGTTPAIPAASPVVIGDNATFDLNNGFPTVGSITGSSLATITLGAGQLTVGGDATSTTFAGTISGSGSFVKIGTGTQTLSGSNSYTGGTTVNGGTLSFASATAFPAFTPLTVNAGGTASAATHLAAAPKNTLLVSSLTLAGTTDAWTGKVDLNNNDMVVRGGSLATVTNQVKSGYNAGGTYFGGNGITSTAAANDPSFLTTLGVIQNSVDGTPTGSALYSTFDGQAVTAADVLVKYTYYGDANLDGRVDGSDYSKIDAGFNSQASATPLTGWFNGDFNYDGKIDGSDYTLIDNAFNTQGAQIAANIASSTAQIAGTSAVPEPTTLGVLAFGAVGLLSRRRRTRDGRSN